MQLDAFEIRIVCDLTNELDKVFSTQKQVIFVEAKFPNVIVQEPTSNLLVREIKRADPNLTPFVKHIGGAVCTMERTTPTGCHDRIVGKFRLHLLVTDTVG